MHWTTIIILIILGLQFGSFANVCIYRWAQGGSVLTPLRSRCPACNHLIPWHENIPVFSFLFLRGKCSACKASISIRYPLIEILLPILWGAAILIPISYGLTFKPLFWLTVLSFFFVLLVTTFTDLDEKIIPNEMSYFLVLISILISPWNPFLSAATVRAGVLESIFGATVSAGILWLVGYFGKLIFRKDAMGLGDVKLMAGFGAFFGWQGAMLALFIASIAGGIFSIVGLSFKLLRRRQYIPFGPFLNLGAAVTYVMKCKQLFI